MTAPIVGIVLGWLTLAVAAITGSPTLTAVSAGMFIGAALGAVGILALDRWHAHLRLYGEDR